MERKDGTRKREKKSTRSDSEVLLDFLLSSVTDILFTLSSDGVFLECFANDETMLYMSPELFLGSKYADVFPGTLSSLFEKAFEETSRTGKMRTLEYEMPLGEGDFFFEAKVLRSEDERFFVVVRDVSETKRSEKRLFEALESAERAEKEKYEFISRICHDIRAPLSGTTGFLALLLEEEKDPEKRKFLNYAKQAVDSIFPFLRSTGKVLEKD